MGLPWGHGEWAMGLGALPGHGRERQGPLIRAKSPDRAPRGCRPVNSLENRWVRRPINDQRGMVCGHGGRAKQKSVHEIAGDQGFRQEGGWLISWWRIAKKKSQGH